MALHLIKLCVGVPSLEELEGWVRDEKALADAAGRSYEQAHVTRMVPSRVSELLDGGSLYWVIKGEVAARQKLQDIRPFVDGEGVRRCALVLEPEVVRVRPRPSRPFQGWRYLKAAEAPLDLEGAASGLNDMPEDMRRELMALGLL
ncbi:DUF1489 family protein [Xanthobacter sp. TB0139]|uniref:DUF1489 family protein n=1 Tax=Xanthobacter sp. TB0139 TaxID=3459178 RepID=UPI00403A6ABA